MPGEGIEPTLPCGNQILSLARLPISPPRRWEEQYKGFPQSFQHSPASNDTRPEGTEVGIPEIGDRGRGPRAFTLWCRFRPWSRVPSPYPLPRCPGLDDGDARAIRQFFREDRSIQDRRRVLSEPLARRSLAESGGFDVSAHPWIGSYFHRQLSPRVLSGCYRRRGFILITVRLR